MIFVQDWCCFQPRVRAPANRLAAAFAVVVLVLAASVVGASYVFAITAEREPEPEPWVPTRKHTTSVR